MKQTPTWSFIEACSNTLSGVLLSWIIGMFLYPLFGFHVTGSQNLAIVSVFTALSIARSFIWRRVFNYIHHR